MATTPRYSPSSYDAYFCLKPPMLLWIAVLYLSRAIVLPAFFGLGSLAGLDSSIKDLFHGLIYAYTFLPSLIAAMVLFALIRRSPSASPTVRWIWAHGRIFLTVAAALDFMLSVMSSPLLRGDINDSGAAMSLLAVVLDLYFLVYVLAARYVRDVFARFPPTPAEIDLPSK
jgi:hypothetical protein